MPLRLTHKLLVEYVDFEVHESSYILDLIAATILLIL